MENKVIYPVCKFCGKQQLPTDEYKTQGQANEAATMHCSCKEARDYQEEMDKKNKVQENITLLRHKLGEFSNYCEQKKMTISDEMFNYLMTSGIAVLQDMIDSVSIKKNKIKITIALNSKGVVVISINHQEGVKIEVV